MWENRYNVTKKDGVGGDPIPYDEPVLVIRAQDVLAMRIMCWYIEAYSAMAHHSPDVMVRLTKHKEVLREWQERNQEKLKMAD